MPGTRPWLPRNCSTVVLRGAAHRGGVPGAVGRAGPWPCPGQHANRNRPAGRGRVGALRGATRSPCTPQAGPEARGRRRRPGGTWGRRRGKQAKSTPLPGGCRSAHPCARCAAPPPPQSGRGDTPGPAGSDGPPTGAARPRGAEFGKFRPTCPPNGGLNPNWYPTRERDVLNLPFETLGKRPLVTALTGIPECPGECRFSRRCFVRAAEGVLLFMSSSGFHRSGEPQDAPHPPQAPRTALQGQTSCHHLSWD